MYGVKEVWYEFLSDYHEQVMGNKYQSVSIDTFTQTWEICRLAHLQELQEKQEPLGKGEKYRERLQPIEYGEPNGRMRSIIYAARAKKKHLILTHYARDEYISQLNPVTYRKEDVRSGKLEMDGFKYIPGLVDLVIHSYMNKNNTPSGIITVSGLNLDMVGHTFEYPDYDKIVNLMEMLNGGE